MKKKTFGRIAALGLAGLTAVPAISIVASADLTNKDGASYEDKTNNKTYLLVSGTTYKLEWEFQKITHTFSLNTSDNTTVDSGVVDISGEGELAGKYKFKDTQYYAYSINATSIPNEIKADVDRQNKEYELKKNKYDEYAYYKKWNTTQAVAPSFTRKIENGTTTVIQYTKPANGEWGFYTVSGSTYTAVADIQSSEPTTTVVEYKPITNPKRTDISNMSTLITELGSDIVSIDGDTNEVTADANGKYKIDKGNSSTTTTPGTVSGNYDLPSDAIRVWNTATYSDACYKDSVFGYCWPNTTAMNQYYGYTPNYTVVTIPSGYTLVSGRRYFNYSDGRYYNNDDGYGYRVEISNLGTAYYYNESGVWYNSSTRLYYLSKSAAVNASSSGDVSRFSSLNTTLPYFSMRTGRYYSTYSAAYSDSGNVASYVIAVNGGTAASAYDYLDPYYYYFMGNRNQTTSKDTSSVKIGNKTGWTAVASSAKSAKSGSTLSVSMNGETIIPSDVLSSIQGRNVTVNFTLKNGVVYTINGNDVSSAKNIDIDTIYNTKNVPSKLVSKAKSKNDGVSTSQLTIDSGSFGSSADVTVKFATKRAGCTARLYRYNSDRNSLSLVDKSTVNSSGKCTFDGVTKGGDFVIVLS